METIVPTKIKAQEITPDLMYFNTLGPKQNLALTVEPSRNFMQAYRVNPETLKCSRVSVPSVRDLLDDRYLFQSLTNPEIYLNFQQMRCTYCFEMLASD